MIVGESGILEKVDIGWNQFQNLESNVGATNGLKASMIEQVIQENGAAGFFDVTFGTELVKKDEPKFETTCFTQPGSNEISNVFNDDIMDCSNIEDMDTDVFNEQFCFSVEELQEPIDQEYQNSVILDQNGFQNVGTSELNGGVAFFSLPYHEVLPAIDSAEERTELKDGDVTPWLEKLEKKALLTAERNLSVSDLVWGEKNDRLWWPGQIFDVSNASEEAMKYFRKDSFLVAYFGDKTFAWNESSSLKPFKENFLQIEKTSTSELYQIAVNSALNEVSKRVEYELGCHCVGKPTHQVVDNAGIRTELVSREGFLRQSSVTSLDTKNLIGYVKMLASQPTQEPNRFDLAAAKSQLTSFYRFQSTEQNSAHFNKRIIANGEVPVPKPAFKVGDCIRRAATQMTDSPSVVNEATDPKSFMYQLRSAAERPYTRYRFSTDIVTFFTEHRNWLTLNDKEHKASEFPYMEESPAPKTFEFVDTGDTYWPDRVVQNGSSTRSRRGRKRKSCAEKSPEFFDENAPAELVMQFPVVDLVPSETNLNRMFRRFGPLKESDTEVDRDTNRARVVFKKRSDASAAHGSASKFNIFGQTLVNYQLNYNVTVPFRSPTSVEGFGLDEMALLLDF